MPSTFLGFSKGDRIVLFGGFMILGTAVGWLLPWLAGWAVDQPWVPFHGPLRLIDSIPQPELTIGAAAVGLIGGTWIAVVAIVEALAVTISDQQVEFRRDRVTRTFTRAEIGAVYLDGKYLVLLGPSTEELAREKPESTPGKLAHGFRSHGYPWADEDPHRAKYRLWVPDLPDLPAGANAVLGARARALAKKQSADADVLRQELIRLGIVVRDEDAHQY